MSEEYFIKFGSPTLAGIKTGNLFVCPVESESEAAREMSGYNRTLLKKGLCMIPMKFMRGKVLVYMFRPKRLRQDLASPAARRILTAAGYKSESPMGLLAELVGRVRGEGEFPHEIGLFLGYPPEDVQGFIENGASGYKTLGTWKVYGSVPEAKKCFDTYLRCTKSYIKYLESGKTLSELTVAI